MILMNTDRPVLYYDLQDYTIQVIDNDFLPYALKDYIKSTQISNDKKIYIQNIKNIECLRDFLSGRILNIYKSNAKAILNSAQFPGKLNTNDRIAICESCRALSMTDNFWLKKDEENIKFSEVNLREKHLQDAAFDISILGKILTVSKDVLAPDINTQGMFSKTWYRTESNIKLMKTDLTAQKINTKAEIQVSNILDYTNVSHVKYQKYIKDDILLAVCSCIATNDKSMISGQDFKDWCEHTNKNMLNEIMKINKSLFSKMVVIDYLLSNTDRHFENFAFLVDNNTNTIIDMTPLYDHNQAIIADVFGTNIDDYIYEPTGKTMKESAIEYFPYSNLEIDVEKCKSKKLDVFFENKLSFIDKFIQLQELTKTKPIPQQSKIRHDYSDFPEL